MTSGASVGPTKMLAAVDRLSAPRRAHGSLHDDGHGLNQSLHHAEMVQQRHQGRKEDDAGQHAEGEHVGCFSNRSPKNKIVSCADEAQQQMEPVVEPVKDGARPGLVFSTSRANTNCSSTPLAMSRRLTRLLCELSSQARPDQHPQARRSWSGEAWAGSGGKWSVASGMRQLAGSSKLVSLQSSVVSANGHSIIVAVRVRAVPAPGGFDNRLQVGIAWFQPSSRPARLASATSSGGSPAGAGP